MNKKRLLKLAALLDADAKKKYGIKFDLSTWAKPFLSSNYFHWDTAPKEMPVNRNTAACAIGLACISATFRGLTYKTRRRPVWNDYIIVPAYGRLREFKAVNKYFGLKSQQSTWLFLPDDYAITTGAKGERAVAKRIRDFVAGKAAPRPY